MVVGNTETSEGIITTKDGTHTGGTYAGFIAPAVASRIIEELERLGVYPPLDT